MNELNKFTEKQLLDELEARRAHKRLENNKNYYAVFVQCNRSYNCFYVLPKVAEFDFPDLNDLEFGDFYVYEVIEDDNYWCLDKCEEPKKELEKLGFTVLNDIKWTKI